MINDSLLSIFHLLVDLIHKIIQIIWVDKIWRLLLQCTETALKSNFIRKLSQTILCRCQFVNITFKFLNSLFIPWKPGIWTLRKSWNASSRWLSAGWASLAFLVWLTTMLRLLRTAHGLVVHQTSHIGLRKVIHSYVQVPYCLFQSICVFLLCLWIAL